MASDPSRDLDVGNRRSCVVSFVMRVGILFGFDRVRSSDWFSLETMGTVRNPDRGDSKAYRIEQGVDEPLALSENNNTRRHEFSAVLCGGR